MTSSMKYFVAGVAAVLACMVCTSDASLMGRGVFRGSKHSSRPKPWNTPRRNFYYKYDLDEEAEDNDRARLLASGSDGEKPCVGLCYYNKLQALQDRADGVDQPDDNAESSSSEEEEIVFKPLETHHKPCVGICQYYRSIGVENPFEESGENDKRKRFSP